LAYLQVNIARPSGFGLVEQLVQIALGRVRILLKPGQDADHDGIIACPGSTR